MYSPSGRHGKPLGLPTVLTSSSPASLPVCLWSCLLYLHVCLPVYLPISLTTTSTVMINATGACCIVCSVDYNADIVWIDDRRPTATHPMPSASPRPPPHPRPPRPRPRPPLPSPLPLPSPTQKKHCNLWSTEIPAKFLFEICVQWFSTEMGTRGGTPLSGFHNILCFGIMPQY